MDRSRPEFQRGKATYKNGVFEVVCVDDQSSSKVSSFSGDCNVLCMFPVAGEVDGGVLRKGSLVDAVVVGELEF